MGLSRQEYWSGLPLPSPENPLEKEMATHSSVLAWRIPGTGKPGGLPSRVAQSLTRLKRLSSSSSSSSSGSRLRERFKKMSDTFSLFPRVVATRSGKQTPSEGQCRQWSAVYYTGGPKAEPPLSQGPRPAFAKTFYTPCARA